MQYLLIGLAVVAIAACASAITLVRNYEKGVVERLGKAHRVLEPGPNIVLPFVEIVRRVDMREAPFDVPPLEVITADNVVVSAVAIVYLQITDPMKVLYNVQNYQIAVLKLAQTKLRDLIANLDLEATLASSVTMNVQLKEMLDEITDAWGVLVTRVEIQKIDPPRDITAAMSSQMKAERERRAAILEAEGVKQSAVLRAEGAKQASILAAEGEAEAIRLRAAADRDRRVFNAEGEAQAISAVFHAINEGGATDEVLAIRYLETLQHVAQGQATKIFMPIEMGSMLSQLGSFAEVLRGTASEQRRMGAPEEAEQSQPIQVKPSN